MRRGGWILCAVLLAGCSTEKLALANACKDAGGHWINRGSWVWPGVPDGSCLLLTATRITFDTTRAVVEDTTGGRR